MKKFISTLLVVSMMSAGAVALAEGQPHHGGYPFPGFPFYQHEETQQPNLNEEAGIETLRLHTTTSTTVRGH